MKPSRTLILAVIFLISQAGILYFLFQLPNPLDALWLQLTYSPGQFRDIVSGWSSGQLNLYLNHYYLDFVHPLIYGSLLVVLFKSLKVPIPKYLFFLPVVGALSDELENICDLFLILNPADFSGPILWTGATASWVKWISLILAMLILIPRVQQKIIKSPRTYPATH